MGRIFLVAAFALGLSACGEPFVYVSASPLETGGVGGAASASSSGTGGATSSSASASGSGGDASASTGTGGRGGWGGEGGSSAEASTSAGESSSASSSSGIVTPPECVSPADCPGADGPCSSRTCAFGVCGTHLEAAGAALPDPTPGDCTANMCDGAGHIVAAPADLDLPNVPECSSPACSPGPVAIPKATGTPCSLGLCDTGACVAQIPVKCKAANQVIFGGCGPTLHKGVIITWQDGGVPHFCHNVDANEVGYCAPGTPCGGSLNGNSFEGVCVP